MHSTGRNHSGVINDIAKKADRQRSFLSLDLLDQLDPRNHLLGLAKVVTWQKFEDNFRSLYAASGRPGKPVQLIVVLLILKQLENLSDERVVEACVQNPCFRVFCGQQRFTWKLPCDPSGLNYFRRRIGEDEVRIIFDVSVVLHGDKANEAGVVVNSTEQEKNSTFPTDAKLLVNIVTQCHAMAKLEDVNLQRSCQCEIKLLLRTIRFKLKGRRQGKSQWVVRCVRPNTGILVRELKRKLSPETLVRHRQALDLCDRVQRQQRTGTCKIYSLHESGVSCISKGKAHKRYEFGAKASVTVTKISGIIVGPLSSPDNPFDGYTLPVVLSQVESIVGQRPTMAMCGQGYRGKRKISVASIEIPESCRWTKAASDKRQARGRFRRRGAIEPIIGHLKSDHRMLRNNLKGQIGDSVSLFMACAAFNFRKFIRMLCILCLKFLGHVVRPNVRPVQACA